MFELSGELIAAAGAAIAGAGGVGGIVARAAWEKMREENKRRERLPCEAHTAVLQTIQKDISSIEKWLGETSNSVNGIREQFARLNGSVAATKEKLQDHIDSIHAHGD